ncbi:MAG: zinc-ribbon domain-containing protein, partial [Candidatus Nucleicultricaceae bacterium]
MIIVCPQCDRRYLTNDADFKEIGRNVRCSGCGHEWFYEAAVEPDDTEPLYADVDPVHSLETVQRKKSYKPLWVLLFLGLILAGIYSERSRLYEAFPQTAKLFQLMGFEKKARHQALIIENLTPLYLEDDPHKSVVV